MLLLELHDGNTHFDQLWSMNEPTAGVIIRKVMARLFFPTMNF